MIKSIDKDNNKIVLSYKELLGDWDENIKEYSEKTVVEGIVKETDKFKNGIFIELKPNLVGLAEFKEVNLFLRGIVPMIGYTSAVVEYERGERFAGESKYPLKKMLKFAMIKYIITRRR